MEGSKHLASKAGPLQGSKHLACKAGPLQGSKHLACKAGPLQGSKHLACKAGLLQGSKQLALAGPGRPENTGMFSSGRHWQGPGSPAQRACKIDDNIFRPRSAR